MAKPAGDEPECGLHVALAVMGGKWKPLILSHLRPGSKRFGDPKRLVAGISEKALLQQLRELVAAEVLTRHDYREVLPKVDYTVTPFGMTLIDALLPLCERGTAHRGRVEAVPSPTPVPGGHAGAAQAGAGLSSRPDRDA